MLPLKWGIAGAEVICYDFANALGSLGRDKHQIVAIASLNQTESDDLAKLHDIPKAYEGYLKLAQDPEVEIVYVGSLNPWHSEIALLMLEHGKHVLVEKPMTMNEKQARKLFECAKRKNLFVMEGLWSRFFPSYIYLREQINSGKLGEIVSVEANAGLILTDVERIVKKALGGGVVLDIGVYAIQLSLWVFQQTPKSVHATGTLNDDGVDIDVTAEINFGENKSAKIRLSGTTELGTTATIVGTKGSITIPEFWRPPTLIDVDGTEKTWPLPKAKHDYIYLNDAGLVYEAEEVRKSIRAGKTEIETASYKESLLIAQIEDEIRRQVGTHYPADD